MTTAISKLLTASLLAAVTLVGINAGSVVCADDPAPAATTTPKSTAGRRWMLAFTHGPLRRVQADDGVGHMVTMLYMTMTVENKTGLPRAWRPLVKGTSDSRPAPYIAGGYPLALEKIRAQEGIPGLESIDISGWKKDADGKLASGDKKALVAIFGPVDPHWATFTVDVEGLVNPITTLKVEKYEDNKQIVVEAAYADRNAKAWAEIQAAAKAKGAEVAQPVSEYQEVRERRSFRISYKREGDEFQPDDDPIRFVSEAWYVPEGTADIPNPKLLRTIKLN